MQTLQRTALLVAPASWKPRAQRQERVALPEPLARLVPLLLLADCSGKVGVVVVEARVELVVQAVLEAVAQAAVVAVVAAVHTQQAMVA